MSRELPFPLSFVLPAGWTSVPPDSCGQPDAGFVAIRENTLADPVATSFVVSGLGVHNARVDIAILAAEHLARLLSRYPVVVLKREASGGPAAHAAQLLRIDYSLGPSTIAVNQIHLLNAFAGAEPGSVAIVEFVMTCPAQRFPVVGREFAQLVSGITPSPPGHVSSD